MTDRQPLVTVAMPLYNGAAHLPAALRLIREQTYDNLEILLCDDASGDATPDICAAAAKEDDRVSYIRHPRNLGMTANFNFGLAAKHGEFFMWTGQDDEKLPTFVEETLAALRRNTNAALACTWTVLITPEGERVHQPYSPAIASDDLPTRLAAFVADTQTVGIYGLFRSSVLDVVGPMAPWLDTDRHFLFNVALRGSVEVVPKPLFRYRLIHGADDYIRMGLPPRPGSADFDLDLYRYLPRLMREAGIDEETIDRSRDAMMVPLAPYFNRRVEHLISVVLHDRSPRRRKVASLVAWARQYPPMLKMRMFWGALKRVLIAP